MSEFTAKDVMKLREETDAPMMECKAALAEANGDFEKAKKILREKGKAAAGKRAGRATSAGVVAFSASPDGKKVAGIVLESETDFVARNPQFQDAAQAAAELVLKSGAPKGSPMDDAAIKDLAEGVVAKLRENIKVSRAILLTSERPIATYIHHDKTKGAAVCFEGEDSHAEAVRKVAIQAVASPPEVVSKDELSQEKIDTEIESETRRAINEGKPENIAKNIAQGRVNKEYVKKVVLLEQPFYIDQSKSVAQYLAEEAKGATVKDFVYLAVGAGE